MVWVRRGTQRMEVGGRLGTVRASTRPTEDQLPAPAGYRPGQLLVDLAHWWLDDDAEPTDAANAVTQRMDLPTRSRGRDADGERVDHDAVTQVVRRGRSRDLSQWVLGPVDHDAETLRLYRTRAA